MFGRTKDLKKEAPQTGECRTFGPWAVFMQNFQFLGFRIQIGLVVSQIRYNSSITPYSCTIEFVISFCTSVSGNLLRLCGSPHFYLTQPNWVFDLIPTWTGCTYDVIMAYTLNQIKLGAKLKLHILLNMYHFL